MAESYGSAKITEIAELAVLMVMTIRIVTSINCFIWCDSSNCSSNYYRCNGCINHNSCNSNNYCNFHNKCNDQNVCTGGDSNNTHGYDYTDLNGFNGCNRC